MAANSSAARCTLEPTPVEAKSSLPGCALAIAISSLTERAGTLGLTSTTLPLIAISPTGAKSLIGT